MSYNNFPKFIEKMICSNKMEGFYRSTVHYMQSAEDISNIIQSKSNFKDPETEFFTILCDIQNGITSITDTIINNANFKSINGVFEKRANSKASIKLSEFYKSIGHIMDKTGILDSLLIRANDFYSQNNLAFFNIDKTTALDEFSKSDSNIEVMFAKIGFYINKICKYIDYSIYYKTYTEDCNNEISPQSDLNGKYLSKLKTDFINNVYKKYLKDCYFNSNNEELLQKAEEEFGDTYNDIFGTYYKNLDLKKDLKNLVNFNFIKNTMYSFKNTCSTYSLAILISKHENKKFPSTIYRWGLVKDDNNKLVFCMEIKDYPMPITLHINYEYLDIIYKRLKSKSMLYSSAINIPAYEAIKINNDVIPTNLLHKASPKQKEILKKKASSNPRKSESDLFLQRINQIVNGSNIGLNQIYFRISPQELTK